MPLTRDRNQMIISKTAALWTYERMERMFVEAFEKG
jgi:hypothetical protein